MTLLKLCAPVLLLGVAAGQLAADPWNKLTRLQVHETIQIPGATLQPGEYVVRLMDSPANRYIVQFFNGEQSQLITTLLAVPSERLQPAEGTELVFYESAGTEPPALRAWYYPGDTIGREFVYRRSEAGGIARRSNSPVLTMDDGTFDQFSTRDAKAVPEVKKDTRIYMYGPNGQEISSNDAKSMSQADRDRMKQERRMYRRYGRFYDKNAKQEPLPSSITEGMKQVDSVMRTIEQRGDDFEKEFQKAIKSSTIPVNERRDLVALVDRLEDSLDRLDKQYRHNDIVAAREELEDALKVAANVNAFMLRANMGSLDQSWSALRSDLNRLATANTFPQIGAASASR